MSADKQKMLNRITAAKAKEGPNCCINKRDYIEHNEKCDSLIDAVYCKMCGCKIKSLIPDDRFEESKTINGKIVIFQRLILAETSNYREILIEFDDGSAHVTCACNSCIAKMQSADLEEIYATDMDDWVGDEEKGRGPVDGVNWGTLAHRSLTRFKKISFKDRG